jgi:hypothetical protein
MTRVLPAVFCLLSVAAAGKEKEGLRWAPTWEAAVEEARARNVPIVIHRHGFY